MNTLKVTIFALAVASSYARPQTFDNFDLVNLLNDDSGSDANVVQTLEEEVFFDDNPQYAYSYQVADEEQQTYIKQAEERDGAEVKGEYSYVDPLGGLVTVSYIADEDGYRETRSYEANFLSVNGPPITVTTTPKPAPRPTPKPSNPSEDLIAKIIAQLTPHIKDTVSNSLSL